MENECETNFATLEEALQKEFKKVVQLCFLDMDMSMLRDVIKITFSTLEKYNDERDIAKAIKLTLDEKYMPPWHCIVGRKFSSKVTFEDSHCVHFVAGNKGFLFFRGKY
ncbi:dynein light chain, cytoplasmic [Trichinella spiralis]|uniref:dynein light chain, cytoplasmic n=1 Tax=Trichinella spiralis TaxID=6334 RepID=UPI0001EFC89B|nr:dynein light chain, cytoplasmic [Trichinella spiralis]